MEAVNTYQKFITTVKSQINCKQVLQYYESTHNLKKYKITEILADDALVIFQQIVQKFYKNHQVGQSSTWVQNQLKLYLWTVICYLEINRKSLNQMTQTDWNFFAQIFFVKEFNLFEYQAKTLLDQSVRSAKWKDNEDILLYNIIFNDQKAKWNQIAKMLYMNSNKQYLRSSKQCRERWLNHLDPSKIKSQWQIREYLTLFEHVQSKGKKWALIVKILDHRRSEHTIKNKYNSIMKKKMKMNPKLKEQEAIQQIIARIHKIIEYYHVDASDQYLFGCTSKILNQQNKFNCKKPYKSKNFPEDQKQNFRKKIQQFAYDQSKDQQQCQKKRKQPKKYTYPKQKIETITPLKKKQLQKNYQYQQQQQQPMQDQIFYEQSYQVNDLLRPNQQNLLMFNDDFKDLIKQHQLDV